MNMQPNWGMPGNAPYIPPKPVRREGECTVRDLVFFVLFLAVSFLLVRSGVFQGFRLGFSAAWLCLLVFSTLYLFRKGKTGKNIGRAPVFTIFLFLFLAAAAPVFALWEDGGLHFFLAVEMIFAFFLYLSRYAGAGRDRTGGLAALWEGFLTAVLPLHKLIHPFRALVKSSPLRGEGKTVLFVILGFLAAIPVLLAVVPLLISADAAFEGLMNNLFSQILLLFGQILLCLLLYPILLSRQYALHYELGTSLTALDSGIREKKDISPEERGFIPQAVALTFLTALSVCYLVYLFSQLAYFFSAFSGILPEGYMGENGIFPVAQYARRGFFEMAAVAAINAVVVSAALLTVRKKEGALPAGVKILGQFVCLFTMVLIGTAMAKMGLYISEFGYTRLRILTSLFMIILFLGFLFLSLRLWIRRFPYIRLLVCAACLVTLLAAYTNVDRWTAEQNVAAYRAGRLESVDTVHLSTLSTSALPALEKLTEDEKAGQYAKAAIVRMYYRLHELDMEGNPVPPKKVNRFASTRQAEEAEKIFSRWEETCLSYRDYFRWDYYYDEDGAFWYWNHTDPDAELAGYRVVEELCLREWEPETEERK